MLADSGARWWRTDTDGDVAVVVHDGRLKVVSRR
jgi:competence protein ComEC